LYAEASASAPTVQFAQAVAHAALSANGTGTIPDKPASASADVEQRASASWQGERAAADRLDEKEEELTAVEDGDGQEVDEASGVEWRRCGDDESMEHAAAESPKGLSTALTCIHPCRTYRRSMFR
jgi:hypothetical protein